MAGRVRSVATAPGHGFSKARVAEIRLMAGHGVEGDAHAGATVKHRSRVARDPDQPNLRQVHLIHGELLDALNDQGFGVADGELGENITTELIDLLGLARRSRLHIGPDVVVEVTGLRNPCHQIDRFREGLVAAVLDRDADGNLIRKSGVMGIVIAGGWLRPGDDIRVVPPNGEQVPLTPV